MSLFADIQSKIGINNIFVCQANLDKYGENIVLVTLSPAPAENSVQAKVAFIFNVTAHNRLNIALNRLNIAHNRLNIPQTKTACILNTGKNWHTQNNQLSGNLESWFFVCSLREGVKFFFKKMEFSK